MAAGVFGHGTLAGRRDRDFRGSVGRPDALWNPTIFRRSMDGSPAVPIGEGSGGALVSRREVGARGVWRESGPPADGGRCDGHAPEGKRGAGRRRNVARRLEAHCLHGRPWRRQAQRLHSGDPGRLPRAITPDGVVLAAERRCATTTPFSVASARRGCSFRFTAERVSLFRRSRLEISRFNGARTADTCIPSTNLRGAQAAGRRRVSRGARDRRPGSLENALAVRPRGRRRHERNRGRSPRTHSAYCYSYMRRLGDLFVVDGLK